MRVEHWNMKTLVDIYICVFVCTCVYMYIIITNVLGSNDDVKS